MTSDPGRLIVIYLIFGSEHRDSGLAILQNVAARLFPRRETVFLAVDNKLAENYDREFQEPLRYRLIGGDNSTHEFSGWDHGYAFAGDAYDLTSDDVILFANDTFHRRVGRTYLDELTPELIAGIDPTTSTIGYCEDFPRDVRLMDITYRSWIRSNIFFHGKSVADRLVRLAFPLQGDEIFSDDPGTFWSDTTQISENWKAYISSWMFGISDPKYPEYNLHWHAAELPTARNVEFFRTKARCILSEHYMAARLKDWQVPIVNFNKLELKPDRHTAPYYEQQPE